MTYDVTIVGGGIVGFATAHRLLEARSPLKLLLLEKESRLAVHQTGNHSGVPHPRHPA
jgi:L-2-hydroxyglutarate oxidase